MLEKNNENILENNEQKIQVPKFEKNPNFKFDEYIFYSPNKKNIEEVFVSHNDNKLYIIGIGGKNDNALLIFQEIDNLNFKKLIKIKDDKESIRVIRYFYNSQDNSEYLVSGHRMSSNIFIYDVINNFKKIYTINEDESYFSLQDCLLFFSNNVIKNNYIYISSWYKRKRYEIKVYSFDNKYIKTLDDFQIGEILHLLFWHDKINDKYFIISITEEMIVINNLLDGEVYTTYENFIRELFVYIKPYKGGYGFIYQDKYLITSYGDSLNIFDLYNKSLYKTIKILIYFPFIVNWNDRYTIAISLNNNFEMVNYTKYEIIDIEQGKVITSIKKKEKKTIHFTKILYHPIYGELFIIVDEHFKGVQLLSSTKIEQKIDFEKQKENCLDSEDSEEDKDDKKEEEKKIEEPDNNNNGKIKNKKCLIM